jgi:hypothetical protein
MMEGCYGQAVMQKPEQGVVLVLEKRVPGALMGYNQLTNRLVSSDDGRMDRLTMNR